MGGKIVIPDVPADKIPPSPVLHGTLRYRLPLSQGGTSLMLRLTNEANSDSVNLRVTASDTLIVSIFLDQDTEFPVSQRGVQPTWSPYYENPATMILDSKSTLRIGHYAALLRMSGR